MSRAFTLCTLLTLSACFDAVRETNLGTGGGAGGGTNNAAGGGTNNATGGGNGGGGTAGGAGNGPQTAEGDATCDQSTCLPTTGNFGLAGAVQLTQDTDYLYAVLDRPEEYTGSLIRLEKSTGARRVYYRDESNPLDPGLRLMVRDGYVYFGRTYAGEIWGILSRVPVAGGEVQEVFEQFGGAGNPRVFPYDVSGNVVVWSAGGALLKSTIPVSDTSKQTILPSAPGISDLAIVGSTVWFIDATGVRSVDLAGGNIQVTVAGTFLQLVIDGSTVLALRSDGAIIHANGADTTTALASFPGATRFVRANSTYYAAKAEATATTSTLSDVSGVQLEAPRVATPGYPAAAVFVVDAQRMYLGTNTTLAWRSTAVPTATCGCATTAPVIPAPAMACERNLCPTRVTYPAGMITGALDGVHLWGVFYDSQASARDLTRYNISGGNGVTFEQNQQLAGAIATDANDIFFLTSYGDLMATDKQATAERTLTQNVRTYPYDPAIVVFDATHAYYLASDGIRRVAKAGGTSELVTTELDSAQLQLDDTHVYFVVKGQLKRAPKAGGSATLIAEDYVYEPGYGLSGAHAYFLTTRGLERRKKDGTGFKTLVLGADKLAGLAITNLTVQTSDLMVVTTSLGQQDPGALWRIKLADGSREKVLQLGLGESSLGFLVDAKGVALSSWRDTTFRERGCSCPNP